MNVMAKPGKITDLAALNGTVLYYEKQGSGPALLFIAGSTGDAGNFTRQGVACERASGDNGDAVRKHSKFFTAQFDERLALDCFGDAFGKNLAIHGERMAAGDASALRQAQQERIETAQFFLQQPRCGVRLFRLERVAANQFAQPVCTVSRRRLARTHLPKHHPQATARDLPSCLRAGQPSANYVNRFAQDDPALSRIAGTR